MSHHLFRTPSRFSNWPSNDDTSDKYTQRDSYDTEAEYLPTYSKDADGKEDCVASLIRHEAAV